MNRLSYSIGLIIALLFGSEAYAQSTAACRVVSTCSGITYTPGYNSACTVDTGGNLCTSAAVSASITPMAPTTAATLSVSAVSSNVALPSGTTTLLCNAGSQLAYYKFGSAGVTAALTDNALFGGECLSLAPGANTHIAGITSTSTTTFNISGGAGLPTIGFIPGAAASAINMTQLAGTAVSVNNGAADAGTQRTVTASNSAGFGTVTPAAAPANFLMEGGVYQSAPPTYTNGQAGPLRLDVNGALVASAAASQTGTWTVQPGNTANTTPWLTRPSDGTNSAAIKAASTAAVATDPALVVAVSPNNTVQAVPTSATAGGATLAHYLSAATTNATNVKASAGTLYSITAVNTTATLYYLKFYDTSSAPTCNTSTVVATFPVPASATGNGLTINPSVGFNFGTGISFCITGAIADNDNTAAATGVAISLGYK